MADNFFSEDAMNTAAHQLQMIGAQLAHGFAFTVRKTFLDNDDTIMVDVTHYPFEMEMTTQVALVCAEDDDIMLLAIKTNAHWWKPGYYSLRTAPCPGSHDLWMIPEFKSKWDLLKEVE